MGGQAVGSEAPGLGGPWTGPALGSGSPWCPGVSQVPGGKRTGAQAPEGSRVCRNSLCVSPSWQQVAEGGGGACGQQGCGSASRRSGDGRAASAEGGAGGTWPPTSGLNAPRPRTRAQSCCSGSGRGCRRVVAPGPGWGSWGAPRGVAQRACCPTAHCALSAKRSPFSLDRGTVPGQYVRGESLAAAAVNPNSRRGLLPGEPAR